VSCTVQSLRTNRDDEHQLPISIAAPLGFVDEDRCGAEQHCVQQWDSERSQCVGLLEKTPRNFTELNSHHLSK